ncbi:MAG: hypothetical protein CMJ69_21435 [Planctomycetaceae bacterium]|nr:hypothetical protein [Planctomycetaceae bacterium]
MKNFVAGVLVTSALLLVGFQGKKARPRYSYQVQIVKGQNIQANLNAVAGRGGRLAHVAFEGQSGFPVYFYWEFEK